MAPLSRETRDPADLRVQLREQHLYYRDRLLPVSRILPHPNYYTAENGADIALLELQDPVSISSHVQLVTLPPASETFPPGTSCWVTGWGNLNSNGECWGQLEGLGEWGLLTPMTQLWGSHWGRGPSSCPRTVIASPLTLRTPATAIPAAAGEGPHRGKQPV